MVTTKPEQPPVAPSRYGCQECREDVELVLSNRATLEVRALYEEHTRVCHDCRRMDRLLAAVYEGPRPPAPVRGVAEERQFHAILQRIPEQRGEPWQRRFALRAGVLGLASAAAALAIGLVLPPERRSLDEPPHAARGFDLVPTLGSRPHVPLAEADNSLRHAAQAYGRIVGGSATVLRGDDSTPSSSNTFSTGTTFVVDADQNLQVGLIGKIVANFSPGAQVHWRRASPSLVELQVDRGLTAFRYERGPKDPVLQVRTPTALVRVVGTVFTVDVQPDEDTLVSVLRGQVDVLDPDTNRLMAEVESGYRYDVAKATFDDVGKAEVQGALPLSLEADESPDPLVLPAGRIPSSWNVPGLPSDPRARTLANVPSRPGSALIFEEHPFGRRHAPQPATRHSPDEDHRFDDEGDDLIAELVRDVAATRRREQHAALETCRELYDSDETRYRAAKCFSSFLAKYGEDPAASQAWALLGMLRMDYALDYRAAEVALQTYLDQTPNGPLAEIATYRMWLAAVEDGRISQALQRGREYLRRYPTGRFVGKIIQRFPELKSAL